MQVTRAARQQMQDMQQHMNAMNNQRAEKQKPNQRLDGEFIDYEEVK